MTVNIGLGILQLFHFYIDAFNMSYIFVFNPIYDVYFCTWILLQTIHWGLLKNECCLSYIEKKILNPNYKLGSNYKWIPHNNVYHNKYTLIVKAIIIISTLLLIIYRSKKKCIKYICIAAIILWIYHTYFYKMFNKPI